MGTTLVGSPETVIKGINRLLGYSQGGFGGILFRAHEWANREQTMRSFELFARYVMPVFQASLDPIVVVQLMGAGEPARQVFGATVEAVKRAFTDHGRRRRRKRSARGPWARGICRIVHAAFAEL